MSDLPDIPSSPDWKELPPSLPAEGILTGMSDQSLLTLAAYGLYLTCPAGEKVISEGHIQDRLYILVTGDLEIFAEVSGAEISLAKVQPGECIGEMTVLVPGPATATVRALTDSVLWSMDADALRSYLSAHPGGGGAFLMGMAQILASRLHEANRRFAQNNIAPIFTPPRVENVITAPTASELSFFEKIKKSLSGERKVKISTEIKL